MADNTKETVEALKEKARLAFITDSSTAPQILGKHIGALMVCLPVIQVKDKILAAMEEYRSQSDKGMEQEKDTIIQQLMEEVERLREEKKEWNEKQRLNNTMQQQLTAAQSLKWVKHLRQKVSFGFEGRKREGIIEGFDPRYGVIVFDLRNAVVPHHYVREDLIDWPASESSPSTTSETRSPISDEEIERMARRVYEDATRKGLSDPKGTRMDIIISAMVAMYKSALQSLSPSTETNKEVQS